MTPKKPALIEHLRPGHHEDAIRLDEEADERLDLAKDAALIERIGVVPREILDDAAGNPPGAPR